MIKRALLFFILCTFVFGCQTTQNIHLNLDLPDGYKLLTKAEPTFTLYTDKGDTVQTFPINQSQQVFTVENNGRYIKGIAKVYYCPQNKEGLCIIHEVTFDIQGAKKNTYLNYVLPEDL